LCPKLHFYSPGVPRKVRVSHKGLTDIKSLETTAVHDFLTFLIHSDHPGQPKHLSQVKNVQSVNP